LDWQALHHLAEQLTKILRREACRDRAKSPVPGRGVVPIPPKSRTPEKRQPDRFQPPSFVRDTTSKGCPTELTIAITEIFMGTILLILLILLLVGALPTWPYSAGWGYYPTGGLGLILLIVLVLVLFRLI
jgi:Protein of unknown function (DUF3309)